MDNWIKGLRLMICIVLLIALCACNAGGTIGGDRPYSSELEDADRQISALEAQIVVLEEELAQYQGGQAYEGEYGAAFVDLDSLLNRIESSDEALESFPALVLSVAVSEAGCTLSFDRLESNPNFEIGGMGEEYLLNPEAKTEQIDASTAFAQYDGRVEGEISEAFADYIHTFEEGGAQFTLYKLGDELVLVSEITVP